VADYEFHLVFFGGQSRSALRRRQESSSRATMFRSRWRDLAMYVIRSAAAIDARIRHVGCRQAIRSCGVESCEVESWRLTRSAIGHLCGGQRIDVR